jgi:hypothetical protein
MIMKSVASATCAALLLAAPALASDSGSLRQDAWPVMPQRSLVSQAAGSWTATASMSTARAHVTATRLGNGRILVVGGAEVSTAELYDPARGRWSRVAPMTTAREHASATLLGNGRVLVAGGGTCDVYSPATGTWTATGPTVFPYASAAAALLPSGQVLYASGSKVKYCGQYSCDEPVADAELYAP